MKHIFPLIVVFFVLVACATGTEKAGQGTTKANSNAWNSASSVEGNARLTGGTSGISEMTEVPLLDKDGKVVLDGKGNVVTIKVGRGFRDLNIFNGETRITSEAHISGTSEATQGQTQTPSNSTPVNVSGVPGR